MIFDTLRFPGGAHTMMKSKTESTALTKRQVITELSRSPHGKLEEYLPIGRRASTEDPEFFAHLIAWDAKVGQMRDAKVALPVMALGAGKGMEKEFQQNALAHLALLSPRDLLRAARFSRVAGVSGNHRAIYRLVEAYLRVREANWSWWERTALQHRGTLKELYALYHVKPATMAEAILFKGECPPGTVFAAVRNLKDMSPQEAAGTILNRKIPFLIASGAMGKKVKDPEVVLALIRAMSPAELVTNTKMLERMGLKENPALRGAYEEGLKKVVEGKQVATFKTTRAAEAVGGALAEKLKAVQEKQLDRMAGPEGDWLVLGDKSGSMATAIEVARVVSGVLARVVKGKVHLIFFDVSPRYVDVTGKTYEEIVEVTKRVRADGGTSVGCGLQYLLEKRIAVDGIAIVTDAQENTPPYFAQVYEKYSAEVGKDVPVYIYRVGGEYGDSLTPSLRLIGQEPEVFDISGINPDYYALPNLVQTMRASRYSLVDEVMGSELLTVEKALERGKRG